MNLLLLLLAAHFSICGVKLGDDYTAFQDKYVDAYCYRETKTTAVCEDDDSYLYKRPAYMRAEFTDDKLTYFSLTSDAGISTAKKAATELEKSFGSPTNRYAQDNDSLNEVWSTDSEQLELSYTSAAENKLGHPITRVSLAAGREITVEVF